MFTNVNKDVPPFQDSLSLQGLSITTKEESVFNVSSDKLKTTGSLIQEENSKLYLEINKLDD